ncbi:unnamed protein product, partial [Rotaria sp. Silwood2]
VNDSSRGKLAIIGNSNKLISAANGFDSRNDLIR